MGKDKAPLVDLSIKITEENESGLEELIRRFQGRCVNNIVTLDDLFTFAQKIRSFYGFIPNELLNNCTFECDPNAQTIRHCPQRYKNSYRSTKFVLRASENGDLVLVELRRDFPNSNYLGIIANFTSAAEKYILESYTVFKDASIADDRQACLAGLNVIIGKPNADRLDKVLKDFSAEYGGPTIAVDCLIDYARKIASTYRGALSRKSLEDSLFVCIPDQDKSADCKKTAFVLRSCPSGDFSLFELRRVAKRPETMEHEIIARLTPRAEEHLLAHHIAPQADRGANAVMYLQRQKDRIAYHERYMEWRAWRRNQFV